MARRTRNFILPFLVSVVLASTACTDLTSPQGRDTPTPSFDEDAPQDSSFTQGQGGDN